MAASVGGAPLCSNVPPWRLRVLVHRRSPPAGASWPPAGLGALSLGALAACGGTAAPAGAASSGAAAAGPSSVAPGTYGKLSLQLSWIKNIEFAGEFFADSKGYYTDAGFESVDLVTGPVDSADALVRRRHRRRGPLRARRDRPLHRRAGRPAQDHRRRPSRRTRSASSRSRRASRSARSPTSRARPSASRPGTNQSIFEGLLKANSIDPATIKTTVVQYEPTPLTEKKVDGFMAYLTNEPFIVKAKGFTPVTLSFADNGLPLASETFVVTSETLESDRDKLKAFLTAEIKGWNDAVADPAARRQARRRDLRQGARPRRGGPDRAARGAERADRHRRHEGQRPVHADRRASGQDHRRDRRRSAPRSPPRSSST